MTRKRTRYEYKNTSELWLAVSNKIKRILEVKECTPEKAADILGIVVKDLTGVLNSGIMPSSELCYRIYRWACFNETFYFHKSLKARRKEYVSTLKNVYGKLTPEKYKQLHEFANNAGLSAVEVVTIAVNQFLADDQPVNTYAMVAREILAAMVADRLQNDPNFHTVLEIDEHLVSDMKHRKQREHKRLEPNERLPHEVILGIPIEDGPASETYFEELEPWK